VILCDVLTLMAVEFNSSINLKNIHLNKLIQILYGFKCFRTRSSHKMFRIQTFRTRHETEKVYYRIRRCVCKRQQEYGTKTFRVRDGLSDLTRSELSLQHEICCRRYIWQCYECSTSALVNITVQSFLVALAQLVRISFFLKLWLNLVSVIKKLYEFLGVNQIFKRS
jgi:hypothetical protein